MRFLWNMLCVLFLTSFFSIVFAVQHSQTSSILDSINYASVNSDVKYYAGLGLHRSGSKIDRRTAHWIKKRLKQAGLAVSVEKFHFKRPISRYAVVSMKTDRINSAILPGMPLLNAEPTHRSIKTKLGFVGQENTAPVVHLYVTPTSGSPDLRARSLKKFKQALESGRYSAVIGVTQGGHAGLAPIAVDLNQHYDTPAMLMSSKIGNFAEIYAEINRPVRFLTRLRYKETNAENIIAKIEGTDPEKAPVVVLMPRSAWWYAAAERGSGVAAFLAAARALSSVMPMRSIIFVSTTGQEFYSLGLKFFLKHHPSLVKQAFAWIYLGANIGTRPVPHYLIQSSSHRMRRMLNRQLAEYHLAHVRYLNTSSVVLPVLSALFHSMPRVLIIAADNNRCERMTCDRWPSNVNLNATVDFAKMFTVLVQRLAMMY